MYLFWLKRFKDLLQEHLIWGSNSALLGVHGPVSTKKNHFIK